MASDRCGHLGVSCSALGSGERTEQPEFLTPIANARDAELVPYWLGEQFRTGNKEFTVNAETVFDAAEQGGPGLFLSYGGAGTLIVQTFDEAASNLVSLREQVEAEAELNLARVMVGPWEGRLYSLPAGDRPVNQLFIFLDVNGTPVVVTSQARDSGVLGQDSNPLLDHEVLINALGQLRPYPQ